MTKVIYEVYFNSSKEDKIEIEKELRNRMNSFLFSNMNVLAFCLKRLKMSEDE